MNFETKLKQVLGQLMFENTGLAAELEQVRGELVAAQKRIAELENTSKAKTNGKEKSNATAEHNPADH